MEDFVTFEIAKKLKEKGFNECCLGYYTNDNNLYFNYTHKASSKYTDCYLSHNLMPQDSVSGKFFDAPTLSQVLEWLREEKKIFIDVRFNRHYQLYRYYAFTMSTDSEDMYGEYPVNTYEQAALAGIEYVLDNLI